MTAGSAPPRKAEAPSRPSLTPPARKVRLRPSTPCTVVPMAAGDSTTVMPALRIASILSCRPPLAAGDDGAGVAHAPAGRRGEAGDEADDGLGELLRADEVGGLLLRRAADLADHDDGLGFLVASEEGQAVDEVGAGDGVTADADAGRLPEPRSAGLAHRLVGQRARARDDADPAAPVDVARHDADLALVRRDDAGAVGADQACDGACERALDPHHVEHRNALGDADHQRDLGGDGLEDRVRREGRRHVDHRGVGAGRIARLRHGVEHRTGRDEVSPPLPGVTPPTMRVP